jgi:hypothetical protein
MKESPKNNALHIPLTQLALGFKSVSWREKDLFVDQIGQMPPVWGVIKGRRRRV